MSTIAKKSITLLAMSFFFIESVASDSVVLYDYEEATTGRKGEWIHIEGEFEPASTSRNLTYPPRITTTMLFMENTYTPNIIYFIGIFTLADGSAYEWENFDWETVVFIYTKYNKQTFTVLEVLSRDTDTATDGSYYAQYLWVDPTRQFFNDIMKAKEYRIRFVDTHGFFIEAHFRDYASHEALTSRY